MAETDAAGGGEEAVGLVVVVGVTKEESEVEGDRLLEVIFFSPPSFVGMILGRSD